MSLPTGRHIKAARILLGIEQRQLAEQAGINPATLSRMENSDDNVVRGQGRSIQAVIDALDRNGVEIYADRLQLKPKKVRR